MKKLLYIFIAGIFAGSLLFTSCKKKDPGPDPDTSATVESNDNQGEFDDIHRLAESAFESNSNDMGSRIAACSVIEHDSATNTFTLTFDSTECADGRVRKGTVTVTYSGGKYRDPGFSCTITPSNYYVDGKKIEGSKTVSNTGLNNNGKLVYSISVTNGKITHPDGSVATWESSRTREWTEGESTPLNPFDDVYTINGTASGVTKNGKIVDLTFTNIVFKLECLLSSIGYPVSGDQNISTPSQTIDINWGAGSCDKDVTIEYKGKTYNKTLQ